MKPNNPQAFPVPAGCWPNDESEGDSYGDGMTLRDYFAAAALTGLLSGARTWASPGWCATSAGSAYEQADAMLAARTRQGGE